MTKEERDEIRKSIDKEISSLEKSINTLTELINSESQSDTNYWFSSIESNPSKEVNELALEKARKRIIILREALGRVDTPGYGICIKCNKPIPFERMKAIPSTTRRISC